MSQSSNIPISGYAWPQFGTKVDNMVKDFMVDQKLPGMTVAVSKGFVTASNKIEERLILSKGYGWANRQKLITMKWDSRVKIGSTTKALVTGPAGWQLMKSKGIVPNTQTLYGPKGLFGNDFDQDIQKGIENNASDPNSSKWRGWYEKITIQNLLDHRSGFTGSGNVPGAAKMFYPRDRLDVGVAKVTYKQAHQYILRTTPLEREPGTGDPDTKEGYSNHGFGLWMLLVPKMSGKSYDDKFYEEYTRDNYLQRIGLHRSILRMRATPDSRDAWGHKIDDNGDLVPLPFENSRLGLAAGGFMASAQDMIRVMRYLKRNYTWDELDKMGWQRGSKDRLSHSGRTDVGGTAFVLMFPDGFVSNSGRDLSHVCVALNTNIRTSGGLGTLASNIALEVPVSGVPQHFDIWRELSLSAIPEANYQKEIERIVSSGYRLVWIDGYDINGKTFFNGIFRTSESGDPPWRTIHGLDKFQYQTEVNNWASDEKGFRLAHIESYLSGGSICYATIFIKSPGPKFSPYIDHSSTQHQEKFDRFKGDGWVPVNVSVVSVNGNLSYSALYEKKDVGDFYLKSFMTLSEYESELNKNKEAGRKLVYLNSYTHNNAPRFVAIWHTKVASSDIREKHGLSGIQYQNERDRNFRDGYFTRAVTGYEEGNTHRYAAFWSK